MRTPWTKGAKLVTGGQREKNLLTPPTSAGLCHRRDGRGLEEPFAPVLPVIQVKDVEDAIRLPTVPE